MSLSPICPALETWPKLWETRETYLDFNWDLSDLESKIAFAKNNPETMKNLASNAQARYRAALFQKEGPGSFKEHFLDIVK